MSASTMSTPFTPSNQPAALDGDTVVDTALSPTPLPAFDSPEFAAFFNTVNVNGTSGGLALFSGDPLANAMLSPPGIGEGPESVSTPTPTRPGAMTVLSVGGLHTTVVPVEVPAASVTVTVPPVLAPDAAVSGNMDKMVTPHDAAVPMARTMSTGMPITTAAPVSK